MKKVRTDDKGCHRFLGEWAVKHFKVRPSPN